MRYQPGLDGLRAVAVAAVLAFHGGFAWASGGFLGVSVFFTLSGFLITSLLLTEHERAGRIGLRAFWSRRFRRLLPASLVVLAGVLLLTPWWDTQQRERLPGDVLAALLDVANWHFIWSGQSYADLFGGPSPVLHWWSLAIEEQFYLAFPLVVAATLAWRGRRLLAGVLVALTAGSVGLTLALSGSPDHVYYGTATRAAELLAGALLALAVAHRPDARWLDRAAPIAGPLAAVTLVLAVVAGGADQSVWYQGGLAAFSLVSVGLVIGVTHASPLQRVMSLGALVAVGRVSYGLYLVHWPIFVLLDEARTGLSGVPLFAVRMAFTVALTLLSYHLVECPVRYRQVLARPGRAMVGLGIASASIVAGVAVVAATQPAPALVTAPAPAAPDAPIVLSTTPATSSTLPPPRRVLVVGSDPVATAELTGVGGAAPLEVIDRSRAGCPIAVPLVVPSAPDCPDPAVAWADLVASTDPDAVVVSVGPSDRPPPSTGPVDLDYLGAVQARLVDVVGAVAAAAGDRPVYVVDASADEDVVHKAVEAADLRMGSVAHVDATALDDAVERAVRPPDALDVLVVGDSTSYGFADSLARAGGEQVDVRWAGGNNCPLVPVTRLQWWKGAEWDLSSCPQPATHWATAENGTDVIVVVESLAEQSRLRYPGQDGWSVAGDAAFAAAHDWWMAAAQAEAARTGAVILLANAPPMTEGGFSDSPMAEPKRVAAWNAQLQAWDARWRSVGSFDYAGPLLALEAAEGYQRPDGVHVEPATMDRLMAGSYLPALQAAATATVADAQQTGCRIVAPDGSARLDLARCDATTGTVGDG